MIMSVKVSTLVLVDFFNVMYRVHFGFQANLSRGTVNTRIPYGFLRQWCSWHNQYKPSKCLLVLDGPGARTYQQNRLDALLPSTHTVEYKANRDTTPLELLESIPQVQSLATMLGTPSVQVSGCEADDVIAVLARDAITTHGFEKVVIVSNDKDLEQLTSLNVSLHSTRKKPLPVPSSLVPDYLALVGDSVDGLPGAKGVGPKTAEKLLLRHGSIEAVIESSKEFQSAHNIRSREETQSPAEIRKRNKALNNSSKERFGASVNIIEEIVLNEKQIRACLEIVRLPSSPLVSGNLDQGRTLWPTPWPQSNSEALERWFNDVGIGKSMRNRVWGILNNKSH